MDENTTKTPAVPDYLHEDGTLTDLGVRRIGEIWREHYVHDATSTISVDADLPYYALDDEIDWDAQSDDGSCIAPSNEELARAIKHAGGRVAEEWRENGKLLDVYFHARERDELGAVNGAIFPEPIEYLFQDLIPSGSVVLVVAPSYELKSWFAMSAAMAVAHRLPWLGHALGREHDTRRTLWVEYENEKEVPRRLHLLGDREGRVYRAAPKHALTDDAFWRGVKRLDPRFVGIDSLSRGMPGVDEKDSRFAEPIARAADYAHVHDCTIFVVAHSPKDLGGRSLVDVVRGSSAVAAAADVVFHISQVRGFSSADPLERRATVRCLKMKCGGREPEPFTVRLTDARGLELYTGPAREPEATLDDRVYAAVAAAPGGASGSTLADTLDVRKVEVLAACKRLVGGGRLRNLGAGRTARFVAVGGAESVPEG